MDQKTRDKYRVVIGLEIHVQLDTVTKIFASDSNNFGDPPNTNISVITLGHPGTLPKLNKKAIEYAIRMGIACNSDISRYNIFDRKNYFYPDLPKGYQVTQDRTPICVGGQITVDTSNGPFDVTLNRIHLEEDAGKSIHAEDEPDTLVDYNRAGTALIEIVTEPCLETPEQAGALLQEIRKKVRYLEICDGNLEQGSLRCDANISVMLKDAVKFGDKAEIKNMNSIRNVQRAIEYETKRQILALELGKKVKQETRTFDVANGVTHSMREKEDMNDYRYFPEPDLCPFTVTDEWLNEIKKAMPPLPRELKLKFMNEYKLVEYDATYLAEHKQLAYYFIDLCNKGIKYKIAANWLMGTVRNYLNENGIEMVDFHIPAEKLANLIRLVEENKVSHTAAAQKIFPVLAEDYDKSSLEIAKAMNLLQESDENSLQKIIDEVVNENPLKVKEFNNGKKGLIGMFMGQVMKKSNGKADPKLTKQLLQDTLVKTNE